MLRVDKERMLRESLAHLDEYATAPPVEEEDAEAGGIVVVSESSPVAAVLLHPVRSDGIGWTAYARIQADSAWTIDGARRLADLLPDELDDVRRALGQLLGSGLPPRPEGLSRKDGDRLFAEFRERSDERSDG